MTRRLRRRDDRPRDRDTARPIEASIEASIFRSRALLVSRPSFSHVDLGVPSRRSVVTSLHRARALNLRGVDKRGMASTSTSISTSTSTFARALEDARALARDARRILDSRDEETDEGTRAKKSLEARRRTNGLRVKVRALSRLVEGDSREENGGTTTTTTTTTSERERRRDAVEALEAEAENAVRRCAERRRTGGGRTARGAATSAGYDESHHAVVDVGGGASRDDDEDGDVEDPRILLRRQRETMDEQDDALDELSIVASRTRDVSLAVNDELDLHAKLLDGVEDEVEDTRERLTAATRAVRQMMRRGSNCRSACIATAVIALCFLILLLIIKLQS